MKHLPNMTKKTSQRYCHLPNDRSSVFSSPELKVQMRFPVIYCPTSILNFEISLGQLQPNICTKASFCEGDLSLILLFLFAECLLTGN